MNRSGCEVHALQINSYGVRPLRVISNALALQSGPRVCQGERYPLRLTFYDAASARVWG